MYKFPMLFKKSSTGKIQQWQISVEGVVISTVYGQKDGKLQVTTDTIKEGKNLGKVNETTPEEQAMLEARASWEKQVKKGYVESLLDAFKGIDLVDGYKPMLAKSYDDHGHKIKYPCVVQSKLDGIRLCSIVQDGIAQIFTRTGKPVTSLPHLVSQLEQAFPEGTHLIDGEAYNHDYKDNFEDIVSMVRVQEPHENHEAVQYHIYDCVGNEGILERLSTIESNLEGFSHLIPVPTLVVDDFEEAKQLFEDWIEMGYEGGMLRNLDAPYEHKRSANLQKYKIFMEEDFPIVGVNEGRGKLAGHAATFTCVTPEGQSFETKLDGSTEYLKELFHDESLWKDKKLSIKFQGYTNKNKVPRFPVGKAVRSYE